MREKKIKAFVASRFAGDRQRPGFKEIRENGNRKVILTSDLSTLKGRQDLDEVTAFLDCGEELLIDQIVGSGLPLRKFRYVICAKNLDKVRERLDLFSLSPDLQTSECGGGETIPRLVDEFLKG